MGKNVQIPLDLFFNLIEYFFIDQLGPEEIYQLERSIKKDLQKKLDSLTLRDNYTTYKLGKTPQERENAHQNYLNQKGFRDSFRHHSTTNTDA